MQLSVYVASADGFKEIVLDPQFGAAIPATKITDDDDLKDAQKQSTAMGTAKITLMAAAQHAVATHAGARVISVYPEFQNGHAIALVTLLHGDSFIREVDVLD